MSNTAYAPLNTGIATLAQMQYPRKAKVVTLRFLTDHHLIKDQTAFWDDSGLLYSKPEFVWGGKPSNPISHSHDEHIEVIVEIELEPASVPPQQYLVTGDATWTSAKNARRPGFKMTFETITMLQGGKQPVKLRSREKLPVGVDELDGEISWSISAPMPAGNVGPAWSLAATWTFKHKLLVTLGPPIVVAPRASRTETEGTYREWGITHRRMAAAIDWIPEAQTDPHIIAETLKNGVGYTLIPDPAVPPQFDHPMYWGVTMGAWPVFEFANKGAHCQAIIRITMAMMRIAGVTARYRFVVIWEEPPGAAGATAGIKIEQVTLGNETTIGLNTTRVVDGVTQEAALIDGAVQVGATYSRRNGRHPQPNKYEACLELEAGGKRMYYGGGSGTWPTETEAVTKSFWGLIWIHRTGDQYRVMEIVKRY